MEEDEKAAKETKSGRGSKRKAASSYNNVVYFTFSSITISMLDLFLFCVICTFMLTTQCDHVDLLILLADSLYCSFTGSSYVCCIT